MKRVRVRNKLILARFIYGKSPLNKYDDDITGAIIPINGGEDKNKDIKHLALRECDCPKCNIHHGRDMNASTNLHNEVTR